MMYLKTLEEKLKPHTVKLLKSQLIIQCSFNCMVPDRKVDDQFLRDDDIEEPRPLDRDNYIPKDCDLNTKPNMFVDEQDKMEFL